MGLGETSEKMLNYLMYLEWEKIMRYHLKKINVIQV